LESTTTKEEEREQMNLDENVNEGFGENEEGNDRISSKFTSVVDDVM